MKQLIAVAVFAVAFSAHAQDWPAERARLIAAAEKEGQLIVNALPNQIIREFMQREWAKDFPKIEMQTTVMAHPQFMARIRTERAAGKFLWDAGFHGPTSAFVLSKEGIVDPLLPEMIDPDVNKPEIWGGWDEAFVDVAGKYVFAMTSYLTSPYYDALRIPPEKVARLGLKVMLDPEYAGKTTWADPAIPGAGLSYVVPMRRRLGDDGLKTLIQERKLVFVQQQQQVVESMARGIAWVGIGPPVRQLMEPYVKAGVKVDARPMGNTPETATASFGGSTLNVFNKRPHPAATRLYVNWILSKEVQTRFGKGIELNSRRRDVPSVLPPDQTPIPGAKYEVPGRESYEREIAAGIEQIKQYRQAAK